MNLKDRLFAFSQLGNFLKTELQNLSNNNSNSDLEKIVTEATQQNSWFDRSSLLFALKQTAEYLQKEKLYQWLKPYDLKAFEVAHPKRIALIMAGNLPIVGFHDFLCVIICGHKAIIKMSSQDKVLLPFLAHTLVKFNEGFKELIHFENELINGFDAVIATGSNNSARYFDYYFGKYPHIIRKNRSSIAILSGNETQEQLNLLADDICLFFGKGCRSVSHLFVPQGYNFTDLLNALSKYAYIANNTKFYNNYEYYKAIFIVNREPFLDSGFILLKHNYSLNAPIGVLNYEFYDNISFVESFIIKNKDILQCVVAESILENTIPFGSAQKPSLSDYADNVDTLMFLTGL
ncbi:MAG: acyl-CoA reductase [Bacteroidales bacterium]|nr:acyl-CoA reductase [Bacteroidales bacterium]